MNALPPQFVIPGLIRDPLVIPDLIRDPCARSSRTVRAERPVLSSVEGVEACASLRFGRSSGKPGLAPAGEALFFASPKKSTQKKGDPMVRVPCAALRGNLRCSPKAGFASTLPSQTIASPDPLLPALLGPARRVGETNAGTRRRGRALRALAGARFRIRSRPHHPSGCAEERRSRRIRASDCLSVASSSSTPAGPSTAGCPRSVSEGGRRQQGRLFLCLLSFWRRKKKVSCRRATPGLLVNNRRKNNHKASTGSARTAERTTVLFFRQVRRNK